LGYLSYFSPPAELDPAGFHHLACLEFREEIAAHLAAEGLSATVVGTGQPLPGATAQCSSHVTSDSLVTVVVCTRNRSHILGSCLDRLAALTYAPLEILVVDNAPSDSRTYDLVTARAQQDSRFRYLLERRPGLSAARNRGLDEARGTFVAFTDDDVAVDPEWIQGLVRGFRAAPDVTCVTGLVCTAEINNASEAYFDARSPSWSRRFATEIYDMAEHRRDSAAYPFSAGIFGTGANFALRRDVVTDVGTFDEALGAGTSARGGEDLDIFVRVLLSGHQLVYHPAAVVWHYHRADHRDLMAQMFANGTGLSAVLTKFLLSSDTRNSLLRRIPAGALKMRTAWRDTDERLNGDSQAPRLAWAREVAGLVAGPWLYLAGKRTARQRLRTDATV